MSDRVPMTPHGYQMLQKELKRLKSEERPKIVKEIEVARAHGDLSENAEYDAAKDRQGQIEARIRQLDDKLARAQVIEPSAQADDKVRFGATVELEDADTGDRNTYRIVGEDEADASNGLISVTSPIARALLGKEPESTVEVAVPKGRREFEILAVRYE